MRKEDGRLERGYLISLSFFAIGFAFYLRNRDILSHVEILAAKHLPVAWLLMLSLYVFRAFVPFLPSFAFYAMSGRIFSGKIFPLVVSLSGVTLLYVLSYLVGLMKKTDKRKNFRIPCFEWYRRVCQSLFGRIECILENKRFLTLLLLSLSPFPQKIFGRICGRLHLKFSTFLTAALLGALPELISVTMLGKGVLDLSSPLFYISLISTLSVALISLIVFQKSRPKEKDS